MLFKKCTVVGVLIMLYLTDSRCHYIPEAKATTTPKKNGTSHSEHIQICGNALTNFIIEACDGIVGSLGQANSTRNSVQTKITEDCCDQGCPLDYIQSYCGRTPLFALKKTLRGKLLSKLSKNRPNGAKEDEGARDRGKKKGVSEVRVEEEKDGRRQWGKRRKKRKKSFKWKCAYKSFGHYLLNLDRRGRVRHNTAKMLVSHRNRRRAFAPGGVASGMDESWRLLKRKGSNAINRTWPSIEIGTISPEVDKFGGQPIVVVRKNNLNSS